MQVSRRPVVAIIATGDELVMPGEAPRPDQIVASNNFALAAMVEAAGAEARMLPIARDNEADLRTVFGLTEGADLIVTIGGASVGDHDLVGKVAADLGLERAFWKIAMRPGKPLMAGRVLGAADAGPAGQSGFGHRLRASVPGADAEGDAGPARACPAACSARSLAATSPPTARARITCAPGCHRRTVCPPITPFDRQDSALLTILTEADALLIRPVADPARKAGEMMDYIAI